MTAIAAWVGAAIAAVGAGHSASQQNRQGKIAKKGQKEQEKKMAQQELDEKRRLGEAESEIGRRKSLKQGGGRSLLMSSTPKGATTIGGA